LSVRELPRYRDRADRIQYEQNLLYQLQTGKRRVDITLDSCVLLDRQKAAGVTVRGYVRRGHTTETNVWRV
jgi:hypothetical protein